MSKYEYNGNFRKFRRKEHGETGAESCAGASHDSNQRRPCSSGSFLLHIKQIKRLYEATIAAAAKQNGLTSQEADVLLFLRENPEYDSARDVAEYRDVSRAYVSGAVELLVGRGFLAIEVDKNDRRFQHLKITAEAAGLAETLHNAAFAFYNKVTDGLSAEELRAMLSAVEKCAANAAR